MQSSGQNSYTGTSEYTEDVEEGEEEQKELEPPANANPQTKQVDRATWKEAKPKLQDLVDRFGVNVYKSNSFTIKSV